MKTHLIFTPILTACGLAAAAAQEVPERLSSLSHGYGNPGSSGSGVMMGDLLHYSRRTVTHGTELWKTDGTAEGTRLVGETITGTGSMHPDPGGVIDGNQLYFSTRTYPTSVWRTDGTAAGTVRVPIQWPVRGHGETAKLFSQIPGGGAVFVTDTEYYFTEDRMRMWRTDGTAEGTVTLAGDYMIEQVQVAGTTIWACGHRLWKSDGTVAGTVVAFTPPAQQLDAVRMVWAMTDDTVLFTTPIDGKWTLHRLDANGATALKETGMAIPSTSRPVVLDGAVHFLTHDLQGAQLLWRSDGTEEGTTLVKSMPTPHIGSSVRIFTVGGKICFHTSGAQWSGWNSDLWLSDGTEAGTVPLMPTDFISPTVSGDRLYFIHMPTGGNQQLWATDGTVEGAVVVAELGPASANPVIHMGATASGLILAGGSTVWRSDGTAAGTVAAPVGTALGGESIDGIAALADGRVLLSAHDTANGRQIWKSDSTAAGTVMVGGGGPGSGGISRTVLGSAVELDGIVYFMAVDGAHGGELWRSDGTAAGTRMLKDIRPGSGSSSPGSLTVYKGEVWFSANNAGNGQRLWRTDGTEEGTRAVTWMGGSRAANVSLFRRTTDELFVRFSDSPTTDSNGLWRTDGTEEGTVRVIEAIPHRLVILEHGAMTYHWVGDTVWRTDGTGVGGVPIHRFPNGVRLIPIGDELLALGVGQGRPDNADHAGLWRIRADTSRELLRPFNTYGTALVSGGVLLFQVTSPAAEAGLWRSDGTVEGTYLLHRLTVNGAMTEHRRKIYFSANDGIHGEEPWVSDGTISGTRMLADLTGDSGGSSPTHFTPAGGKVFFAATTEAEGSQLYVVDAAGVPARYDVWMDAHRMWMDGRTEPWEDADGDGHTNLQEFAFGGDPADAAVRPFISSGLAVVPSPGGGDGTHLSLTLPVRRGTVFTAGRPATGAADGVTYRIVATEDLGHPVDPSGMLEVREDTAASHPPHADEDYEYRTFRLDEPVSARERAFLRVVTE